jgi:hypothetical protein
MMNRIIHIIFLFLVVAYASAQQDTTKTQDNSPIEKLKYEQQPGLALAASKIFFSDKRYSISGFGEFNYVPMQGNVNRDVGDLELYYTGLYRYATFFGYRIKDNLIWNSEFQIEFLHDGNRETHHEIVLEAFLDYRIKDYLKLRFGFYPLTIGYVNNNDEPVMFYSVNRAEVERLIIPSTWIEFGSMLYGNINKKLNYALGVSQGLNAQSYLSGTWIRQGREIRFDVPKSLSINPQLNYYATDELTLSVSGYYGNSGQRNTVLMNGAEQEVKATIGLVSGYAKYDWKNFRFVTVATYGQLGDTDKIYELTKNDQGIGQVLGSEVYGYLAEAGCDILPYLRKNKEVKEKHTRLYNTKEMKFSIFTRFEQLNTHHNIHQQLQGLNAVINHLNIYTFGLNFNTRENIVIKANYQYRKSLIPQANSPINHVVETGVGFIF